MVRLGIWRHSKPHILMRLCLPSFFGLSALLVLAACGADSGRADAGFSGAVAMSSGGSAHGGVGGAAHGGGTGNASSVVAQGGQAGSAAAAGGAGASPAGGDD